MPLSLLMENSVLIPLRVQLSVANAAILNYLLVDADLMSHFRALRSYLFLHNGEFAGSLASSVFKEASEVSGGDLLNPATLNGIVRNALVNSTLGAKDPMAENVGFAFRDDDMEGIKY